MARLEQILLALAIASCFVRTISAFATTGTVLIPRNSLLQASRSTRTDGTSTKGPTRKTSKKGGGDKRRRTVREPLPRAIVTDYELNTNPRINQARLTDSIGCEHFGACPGCMVDANVESVDVIRSAKVFFSSTGVRKRRLDVRPEDVVTEDSHDGFYKVVVPSSLTGWRTQAKLAATPRSSAWEPGCNFGLYKRGTHDVMEIPNCQVHHPAINRAVDALVRATESINIAAYNEKSGEGGLRYVQLVVERSTGKISLTLIWNADNLKGTQPALARLTKELQRIEPDLWHNIWCHCNDGPGNNIFARNENAWYLMVGQEFVREPLPVGDKGWIYFSPLAFRQGNMDGFDILATDVAKNVPGGSRVCELYAGVGLLGLTALAYHANGGNPIKWVRCSDENPANPRCFNRSVDSLPPSMTGKKSEGHKKKDAEISLTKLAELIKSGAPDPFADEREKTSYMVASAKKALFEGQALGADCIIVDPPRKGLEPEVLDEFCKPFNPNQQLVEDKDLLPRLDNVNWANDCKTLVYVSCGFDALARDCDRLLRSNGGWMLQSATGYILFPGSDHVETLAVFQRR